MDLATTKFIVRNVVSWCVGGTVISLVKQNVAPKSNLKKAEVAVGATALSMMIVDDIGKYTDTWIDGFAVAYNKAKNNNEDPTFIHH